MHADNDNVPVFDRATDRANATIQLGAVIPASKIAARQWLDGILATGPTITYCKYRPPRGPAKWKTRTYVAANDNEPSPLFEALRRDGREADIPLVMRYRLLVDVVGTSAYDDEIDMAEEGIEVQSRSLKLSGSSFEKSFSGMTATSLPGGEISYREQRQSKTHRMSVGQRTMAANDDTDTRSQVPLRLARSEDDRIARIDGEPVLRALRVCLGELVDIFESAALGFSTLTDLGGELGFKHKARSREAKLRVYTAIDRLRDQWRMIDRQMAAQEAACERRVLARRRELAEQRAAFFGLAA